ncbi:Phage virion morphogenesis family protein [compost metagenome]
MSGIYSVWGGAASPVQISSNFDNKTIYTHLARLAAVDASRFEGARREIGEFFLGEIQDNFEGQKLFDGTAMPQSRAAIARRGKTLIDKHHLYDSYTYQLPADGVEVGSSLVSAAIHHFGGMTGRGRKTKIVARPVLGVGPTHERQIGDILIKEIGALQ